MAKTNLEPLRWRTEVRRVNSLIPLSVNPRKLTEQQRKDLEESLTRFNLVEIPAINLDNTGGTEFPIHDMFSEAGGIIVENLANLDLVDFAAPFFIFLPLKLVGCDGSPVRAVAGQ